MFFFFQKYLCSKYMNFSLLSPLFYYFFSFFLMVMSFLSYNVFLWQCLGTFGSPPFFKLKGEGFLGKGGVGSLWLLFFRSKSGRSGHFGKVFRFVFFWLSAWVSDKNRKEKDKTQNESIFYIKIKEVSKESLLTYRKKVM